MKNYYKALVIGLTIVFIGTTLVNAGGYGSIGSFNAYGPLFGGQTTTGAIQSSPVGAAGTLLTSNGPGVLPTFQSPQVTGLITAGTNVTISGSGTVASPYSIAASGTGSGGAGTVTSVSVASANGFTGTVANATTTPAITLSTTASGVLKGSGGSLVAATGDTDYQNPITLTTTASSGVATFSGDILNIPNYATSQTYQAGTGLTLTGNSFAVNTSQNIATLSNLTSNGFVKTSGGAGTLSIDTTAYTPTTTTVAGFPLSGNVTLAALTATNGTLTFSGSYTGATAQTVGINLANANTWTGAQTISTTPFTISGNQTNTAWTTAGTQLSVAAATLTDSSSTGTVTTTAANAFGIPTLAATNTGVTYTNAATVYIAGAPTAGTDVTDTNPYALDVASGNSNFGGNIAATTFNGLTLTANSTGFGIAGGTTSKTLTVSNTLTLAGTDGSTLNIGAGGTLGSAAFTSSSAYQTPITLTTTGSSGTATFTGGTLNIPNYAGGVTGVSNSDGTLTISPTSGAVVASLNLAHANTFTGAQTISTAPFTISGNQSQNAWTTNGTQLSVMAATLNDATSTGTVTNLAVNSFGIPTITATNTSVTYTNAGTVYIAGAPVNGTNVTIANKYSLWVAAGGSLFGGSITTVGNLAVNGTINSSGSTSANLQVLAATQSTNVSTTGSLFGGASNVNLRTLFGSGTSTSTAITANASYANIDVGSAPVTAAASGTHALLANLVVNPIGTVTNSTPVPITNTATLYVNGASTATSQSGNYALYVNGDIGITGGQTTVNCSTSGSVVFSEPFDGPTYKQVIAYENACLGTASYTYPKAFTNTPDSLGVNAARFTSISTSAVTVTGVTTTGFSQLYGY